MIIFLLLILIFFTNDSIILIKHLEHNKLRQIPFKQYNIDAGFDVKCIQNQSITPGVNKVKLGFSLYIPQNTFIQYYSRSSILMKGLYIPPGIIDAGYTGEQSFILFNPTNETFLVKENDRIAQLVLHPYNVGYKFLLVDDLPETERGSQGIGSSGK